MRPSPSPEGIPGLAASVAVPSASLRPALAAVEIGAVDLASRLRGPQCVVCDAPGSCRPMRLVPPPRWLEALCAAAVTLSGLLAAWLFTLPFLEQEAALARWAEYDIPAPPATNVVAAGLQVLALVGAAAVLPSLLLLVASRRVSTCLCDGCRRTKGFIELARLCSDLWLRLGLVSLLSTLGPVALLMQLFALEEGGRQSVAGRLIVTDGLDLVGLFAGLGILALVLGGVVHLHLERRDFARALRVKRVGQGRLRIWLFPRGDGELSDAGSARAP